MFPFKAILSDQRASRFSMSVGAHLLCVWFHIPCNGINFIWPLWSYSDLWSFIFICFIYYNTVCMFHDFTAPLNTLKCHIYVSVLSVQSFRLCTNWSNCIIMQQISFFSYCMCSSIMSTNRLVFLQASPDHMFNPSSWKPFTSSVDQCDGGDGASKRGHQTVTTAAAGVVWRQTVPGAPCCPLPSALLPGDLASRKPAVTFICSFRRQRLWRGSLSWMEGSEPMSHKEENDGSPAPAQTGAAVTGARVVIRASSKHRQQQDDKSQQTPSTPQPSLSKSERTQSVGQFLHNYD